MADIIFAGYHEARDAGLLAGTPDIRLALVMSGFTGDADSVNVADVTLDEFDGVGYARLDAASVTAGYVDADDEWQLAMASGDFGDPVAPGSDVIAGMVAILNVDGTAANDYILGFTDTGGFGVNANNGPLNLTIPAAGLMFDRQAA